MVHRKSEYRLSFKWLAPDLCRQVRSSAADYRLLRRRTDLAHDDTWAVWNIEGTCDCDSEDEANDGEGMLPVSRNRQKHNELVQLYEKQRTRQTNWNLRERSCSSPTFHFLPTQHQSRVQTKEAQIQTVEAGGQHPQSTQQYGKHFHEESKPGHEMKRIVQQNTKPMDLKVKEESGDYGWQGRTRYDVRRKKLDVTPAIVNDCRSNDPKRMYSTALKKNKAREPTTHSSRSRTVWPTSIISEKTTLEKAHSPRNAIGPSKSVIVATKPDTNYRNISDDVVTPINHSSIWMTEYRRNFARKLTNG